VNRPPVVVLLWGIELAALLGVGAGFGFEGAESPLLLGGAAVAALALAASLALGRADRDEPDARLETDLSPASAWLGVALVLLALSAELGLWLTLIAGGMLAGSAAALVRELCAQHRSKSKALSGGGEG
jgi:hypothetical protein